jgi:hypothetical protein
MFVQMLISCLKFKNICKSKFLYVCKPFLKKDRKIANSIKGFILILCVVSALISKHYQYTTESLNPTETEQSDEAQVYQTLGIEATLPLQKVVFNLSFDFVIPFTFIEKISIKPTIPTYTSLFSYFKEVLLCSIPSLAP